MSRATGWISPVILDAGRVAGVWEHNDDLLRAALFAESEGIDASVMTAETERLGAALGRKLRLGGNPRAGGH